MIIGIDIRPLMDKQYSGVSEYTLNLLTEIFHQDKDNQYRLFYNSYHDISARMPQFNQPNISVVKTAYPNKILNYVFFNVFKRPKIDKLLGGVDIMFMPHFNFISLSRNSKKIITIHDLSFLHFAHFFAARQNFWHRNINIKKMLRNFDQIIAVSENTKQDIISICGIPERRIKVIHSGISSQYQKIPPDNFNLERVREKYHLPKNFILYLGNLEPRKNIEGIIEAFEHYRINNQSLDVRLVIAGGQSWKYHNIFQIAKKSHFRNLIHFIDYIEREDKVYLYNLAKLFIFPSFYEGFGFPPLEAAACGTPVIASNTSSLPEILDNAAILVNPYDVNEITEAIKEVVENSELREHLVTLGLQRVEKFKWEKCAQAVIEAFSVV